MSRFKSSLLLCAGWCGAALLSSGCLEVPHQDTDASESSRCAKCHGDASRSSDFLLNSAPPIDLAGSSDVSYPGVGSHLSHVLGSESHGPVRCSECHVVPTEVDEPGHADDELPAEVSLGRVAQVGGGNPSYDFARRSCSETWCHGDAEVTWTRPRSEAEVCGSCHGLPPALPHPQVDDCSACHGDVIDEEGTFIAPDLHVDGTIQVMAPGCSTCHGSDRSGAPPPNLAGDEASTARGVGAHAVHSRGTDRSRAVACSECHSLPPDNAPLSHIDAQGASVSFSGTARAEGSIPIWDARDASCSGTWCHVAGRENEADPPQFTSTGSLGCGDCHGFPPDLPHPQSALCETCHAGVAGSGENIISPERHVDGVVDVDVPADCTACHGDGTQEGNLELSGAHTTHILGTQLSRPVPCEECHIVPGSTLSPGHVDTPPPVELEFSGVATAYGAQPVFDSESGACSQSYCHGADFEDTRQSGGSLTTPRFGMTDGSQAACGSCHGLPPPAPGHPPGTNCSSCHRNVRPDNVSFFNPALHVNGVPETVLP